MTKIGKARGLVILLIVLLVPFAFGPFGPIATGYMLIAIGGTFIYFFNEMNAIFAEYDALPESFSVPEDLAECFDYEMIDDSFILAEKNKLNEEILDEMRAM